MKPNLDVLLKFNAGQGLWIREDTEDIYILNAEGQLVLMELEE